MTWLDEVNALGCGALVLSRDGRVHASSPTIESTAPGGEISQILTPGSAIYWETNVMPTLLAAGHAHDVALELRGPEPVPILCFARIVGDEIHCILVPFRARDRFARAVAEAEKRRAADAAELAQLRALEKMRSEFINIVSHEMATPMTPVLLQLRILESMEHAPAAARAVAAVKANLEKLQKFHGALLEAAQVATGLPEPELVEVDLRPFVEAACESWATQNVVVEGDAQARVDKRLLSRCIHELLDNAAHFSENETIRVSIGQGPSRISIVDQGRGIDPAQAHSIGSPFAKAHDANQDTALGAGLGLYLVDAYMRHQGGSLRVASEGVGMGTQASLVFDGDA